MLASMAVENGWAGLVINGCIRDSKVINGLNVGVKALGTHPLKSIKEFRGERGGRITFAGVEFVPGHWLYSDEVRLNTSLFFIVINIFFFTKFKS